MGVTKTHEEYVAELAIKNPDIEVIGEYSGVHNKILHRCKKDDYIWEVTPDNILRGKGCPKCSKHIKFTHEDYVNELALTHPNIQVMEEYINNNTPIMHKCLIHNIEWKSVPATVKNGYGCKECVKEYMREKRVKSRDEYIEQLNLINPNIMLIGDYINAHTPTLHRCLIDGYEWMLKPNNALSGKGCPNCYGNIKKNQLEYVEELSLKNPNLEVLEDYINAKTPILHRCKRHNIKWKISPDNALHGYGCKECLREKIGEKNSKTHEQYVKELKEINPNIIVLGEYIDAKTPILHRCLIDGYEWMVRPDNVLCGTGCPKCAGNIKKTHEEYVYELSCINPYIKVIEKYIDSVTPILHECLIDGYQWYAAPTNLLSGCGCPQCHESSGERQIRTWLEKHDVLYDFQKRFSDCKDINSLPFDFYLPDYNIAIEYDGKQHFEPIEYFGGVVAFERTVKHDNIKNNYCKNNGISLLRIPYNKNVEEELNNFLFI